MGGCGCLVSGPLLQGLLLLLLQFNRLVEVLGTSIVVVVRRQSLCLGGLLFLLVGLLVEVVEQEVEEDCVGQGEAHRPPGVATIRVQQLGLVDEGAAELDLQWEENGMLMGLVVSTKEVDILGVFIFHV